MAWNKTSNKSLQGVQKKVLSPGAPVAYMPGKVGRPYHDGWNIERAYQEGVARVTWVYRAIDAIASNQAKLPIQFRKDDARTGEIVDNAGKKYKALYDVLNSQANIGESSFAFRYRISTQLLISTRGVFIEIIRSNNGEVESLHLLPPQSTAPIPHSTKFVSGYEVKMPDGNKKTIKPENVVWLRRPHPLDPYLSLTPMESAGVAIEVEQLAKLYNRNFLLNDGRPGGLLVLRGEIDPVDRDELQTRFRGNLRKTGAVSVISSDDGADFVDLGSSPRDMAYQQMRAITKEEILAAFGVPETVIGNASGRTFSNAIEEVRVFWQETMEPHLLLMARGFDQLSKELYVDYDTSTIPVLVLSKQEREKYLLDEFQSGAISANEYRDGTGRAKVVSELSDALLANPNLTPIGNTEKETLPPDPANAGQPGLPLDVASGDIPVVDSSKDPNLFGGGEPALAPGVAEDDDDIVGNLDSASLPGGKKGLEVTETKNGYVPGLSTKADSDIERWEGVFGRTMERFFDRQQRVVAEKAESKRVRRALDSGVAIAAVVDLIFDEAVWNRSLGEDLKPVIVGAMADASRTKAGSADEAEAKQIDKLADEQVERAEKLNGTTKEQIAVAVAVAASLKAEDESALSVKDKMSYLRVVIGAIYVDADSERKAMIAENEAYSAYNGGRYVDASTSGVITKTWLTRKDDKVRDLHKLLHGKSVAVGEAFNAGGVKLRFPGDPAAPANATIGCRCILGFGFEEV